ncbi:MAG: serine/threonine protein kinase [Polyangiaceae bacterium]|nr:serine/threonine protein kinase [Polyangiaceae bacterium]
MNAPASVPPAAVGIAPGDEIAGKYRVERILGQGGMGIVVAAVHIHLDERVAIKLLRPEGVGRSDAAERFMREAKAAVKIKSQHVAKVLDVGILSDGRPYMVMEYLEGRDLGEELDRNGPMPEAVAVEYVLQACDALAEAHKRGIVHRDLKPSNLFLCKNQKPPIIKLLDFGVSKFKDNSLLPNALPSLTAEAALLGTPYYMSPEQIRSAKDVDERADVWALGVILYELISGRVPFDGTSATAVLAGICGDKPKPLHEVCQAVSSDVSEIVGACLAKNLDERMPNVRELVRALAAVAPDKASTIDERLAAIETTRNTADTLASSQSPASIRVSAPMSKDEMLGATVGGVAQTAEAPRNRSMLVAIAIASALVTLGVGFVLVNRERVPVVDTRPIPSAVQAAPPEATPSVATIPAVAVSVLPSAPVIVVEPAPMQSSIADFPAGKPTANTKSTSSPPTRSSSTSGPIQLGKEVETRR